jgi:hypothetical protein
MACGLAANVEILKSSAVGCCMASLAVEQMGNEPITRDELRNRLISLLA